MLLTKNQIIKKLEKNKDKIKSFGVKKLWLFGSYARGEQKEDSDIDFLVEFEKYDYLKELDLQTFLYSLFEKDSQVLEKNNIRKDYRNFILNKSFKQEVLI